MGLIVIAPIAAAVPALLTPGGALVVEIGAGPGASRRPIVRGSGACAGYRRVPILTACRGRSLATKSEWRAMSNMHWPPAKKSVKKHLECRPEPTSLRATESARDMVPRCLKCPEHRFLEVGSAGQLKRKLEQRSRIGRQTGSPRFRPRSFIGSARICEMSRITRGSQHRSRALGLRTVRDVGRAHLPLIRRRSATRK